VGPWLQNKRKQTKFALTKKVKEEMRQVSLNIMKYMGEVVAEAIDSIQTAEKKFPSPPCYEMGGENSPGSCIMISRNLDNSAHVDFMDGSLSLAIWAEEEVGSSSNWYFILTMCNMKAVEWKSNFFMAVPYHGMA
jgi:hypothetical protein